MGEPKDRRRDTFMQKLQEVTDPRVKELILWWSEEAYPKITGKPYCPVWGKEGKMLKASLQYFDRYFKIDAVDKFKEAALSYLKDTKDSYIVEKQYPLSIFLAKPHQWVKVKRVLKVKEEKKEQTRLDVKNRWLQRSVDEFLAIVIEKAAPDPIKYTKAFVRTHFILKDASPEKWMAAGKALKELIGEERFAKIWKERSSRQEVTGFSKAL